MPCSSSVIASRNAVVAFMSFIVETIADSSSAARSRHSAITSGPIDSSLSEPSAFVMPGTV